MFLPPPPAPPIEHCVYIYQRMLFRQYCWLYQCCLYLVNIASYPMSFKSVIVHHIQGHYINTNVVLWPDLYHFDFVKKMSFNVKSNFEDQKQKF